MHHLTTIESPHAYDFSNLILIMDLDLWTIVSSTKYPAHGLEQVWDVYEDLSYPSEQYSGSMVLLIESLVLNLSIIKPS